MSEKKIDDGNLKGVAGGGLDTHLQVDPNKDEITPGPGGDSPDPPGGGSPDPESEGGGGGNQDLQI